jgi:hypothetical protein
MGIMQKFFGRTEAVDWNAQLIESIRRISPEGVNAALHNRASATARTESDVPAMHVALSVLENNKHGWSNNPKPKNARDIFITVIDHADGIDVRGKGGKTIFLRLAEMHAGELLEKVRSKGADVNATDFGGNNALSLVLSDWEPNIIHEGSVIIQTQRYREGKAEYAVYLLSLGINPNRQNVFDEAPLHIVCKAYAAALGEPLQHEDDGRTFSKLFGWVPIEQQAAPFLNVIEALLQRGADPELQCRDRETGERKSAIDLAPTQELRMRLRNAAEELREMRAAKMPGRQESGRPLQTGLKLGPAIPGA